MRPSLSCHRGHTQAGQCLVARTPFVATGRQTRRQWTALTTDGRGFDPGEWTERRCCQEGGAFSASSCGSSSSSSSSRCSAFSRAGAAEGMGRGPFGGPRLFLRTPSQCFAHPQRFAWLAAGDALRNPDWRESNADRQTVRGRSTEEAGESAKAQKALDELPAKIDHERHAALLEKFGIDPGELAEKAAKKRPRRPLTATSGIGL